MKKTGFYLVAVISLFLFIISSVEGLTEETGSEWVKVSNGIMDADLEEIVVSRKDPDMVYITSNKAVYVTGNGGKSWSELLSFRTTER
jgi:hypothetical protein